MLFEELLFERNKRLSRKKTPKLQSNKYIYTSHSQKIDINEINNILLFLSSIRKRHALSLAPIILDLGDGGFEDKLSYVLLECIAYHLIEKEKCKLILKFYCKHTIYNEGIKSSYLNKINGTTKNNKEFINRFKKEIYKSHYRNIVALKDFTYADISRIVQDIDSFLKPFNIESGCRASVSDVVGELVDNAVEHSKSDCLVDLDVTTDYSKNGDDEKGRYCGVNIVILNFSEFLIGDKIAKKIKQINTDSTTFRRYFDVIDAHKYHSNFFTNQYSENDFFTVAAFQHKISGRATLTGTGGTGLTQLIKILEEKSDAYNCYLLSGSKKINLIKPFLVYDDNKWIGFNNSHNFLSDIPDGSCFENSGLYFPGTAYNLNFILKRED